MNLPTTTSEITASWMTDALRASGVIGGDVDRRRRSASTPVRSASASWARSPPSA